MNYPEISKETVSYLHKSYASLKNSPLNPSLRVLLELRTSQINRCAYCCRLHTEEAKKLNIPQEKLDLLAVWQASQAFSDAEKLALQWCEVITDVDINSTGIREKLFEFFSEREIVNLTACVSIMNALNRVSIFLRD